MAPKRANARGPNHKNFIVMCGRRSTQPFAAPTGEERPLGARSGLGWDVAAPLALDATLRG